MNIKHRVDLLHQLKRAASVASIVTLSVVTTLFVQHFAAPSHVAAQSSAQRVVTSNLVVQDSGGNVVGRVEPDADGNGALVLYDNAGNQRVVINGRGVLRVWDANGNPIWLAP